VQPEPLRTNEPDVRTNQSGDVSLEEVVETGVDGGEFLKLFTWRLPMFLAWVIPPEDKPHIPCDRASMAYTRVFDLELSCFFTAGSTGPRAAGPRRRVTNLKPEI
jgi:hypothetical protein